MLQTEELVVHNNAPQVFVYELPADCMKKNAHKIVDEVSISVADYRTSTSTDFRSHVSSVSGAGRKPQRTSRGVWIYIANRWQIHPGVVPFTRSGGRSHPHCHRQPRPAVKEKNRASDSIKKEILEAVYWCNRSWGSSFCAIPRDLLHGTTEEDF